MEEGHYDEGSMNNEQLSNEGPPRRIVYLVFVMPAKDGDLFPSGALKLNVRSEDLPRIYGCAKLAKILAKHCLTPVVKSASRLTLYWLGDVIDVADRLRRGEIVADLKAGTVTKKSQSHKKHGFAE